MAKGKDEAEASFPFHLLDGNLFREGATYTLAELCEIQVAHDAGPEPLVGFAIEPHMDTTTGNVEKGLELTSFIIGFVVCLAVVLLFSIFS